MCKSTYVGVYQIKNRKMHGESLKLAKCTIWGYYENWSVLHIWLKKKQNISWKQFHDIKYHAQMQQQAERHEL
jgi:hypothetical protein